MSRLFEILKRHEGLRLKPYRDTLGILTIGYGRNLEESGLSISEAEALLKNDIYRVHNEAEEYFPWFEGLSQVRKDVVLSMIFNLGLHGFMGFRKMILAVSVGNYELASREMIASKWAVQVGPRAYELSEMFRSDEYLKGGDTYE